MTWTILYGTLKPMSGVEVFENNISTAAVNITVKSLPSKNKPAEFNGATGRFRVSSSLEQQALTKNQQGFLSIKIEGAGNFSQLLAPVIKWPAGIEGFDPVVIDEWDKQAVPLKGSRIFRYAFVAANPGSYEIPAVSFSFFDPDSNRYRVLNSKAIQLSVSKEARKEALAVEKKVSMQDVNKKASYIAAGVVIIVLIVILVFWAMSDRGKKKPAIEPLPEQSKISVDDALQPAWMLVPAEDKDFYTALNQAIWTWLAQHFNRQGMGLNKQSIRETLLAAGNDPGSVDRLMDIIHHSETAMFTKANMNADKLQIMHDTQILLQSIKA